MFFAQGERLRVRQGGLQFAGKFVYSHNGSTNCWRRGYTPAQRDYLLGVFIGLKAGFFNAVSGFA
jgi:hypothetical protein